MAQYQEGQRLQGSDGHIYVVRNGQPVMEGPTPLVTDPKLNGAVVGQGLNNQGQALQNQKTAVDLQNVPLQRESTRVGIEQNRQSMQNQRFNQNQGLRQEYNNLPLTKNYATVIQKAGTALHAPDTPAGDLAILYSFATVMDPNSVVRESEQEMAKSTAERFAQLRQRFAMNGEEARLPKGVRPGLLETLRGNVAVINQSYNQQRAFYGDLARRNGFQPYEIVGPHLGEPFQKIEAEYIKQHHGTPRDPYGLATGGTKTSVDDAASAAYDKMFRSGASYEEVANLAQQLHAPPPDRKQYENALAALKRGDPIGKASVMDVKPTSGWEQFASSPVGAGLAGFAKAGTLGSVDEMAAALQPGDYSVNRDANDAKLAALAGMHPGADMTGQLVGGATAGYGLASGLAKVPGLSGSLFGTGELLANGKMANPILGNVLSKQGLAGDALYSTGYGAGSNNHDRLEGAKWGGILGVAGGAAARGALSTAAQAISPSGGKMRLAYDMGVRPSIGQRVGGPIDFLEEKMQSLPGVGDAIRGTRDRAVDQFQLGLHNDGLKFIGDKLPEGTTPGFQANAYSQAAEKRAYGQALTGMTAKADPQLGADLGGVQQKVAALGNDGTRFKAIWDQSVGRRFKAGGNVLTGDEYKAAESELGAHIRRLSKNPANMDLVDTLKDAQNALRGSAFRNSPPDAVDALKNADSMHARLVRIENASNNDIGEPGEFSPKSYAKTIRTEGGGVRNRNYLAGKALNADLAAVGMRLGDKVSNSFTWDRAAVPVMAAGAGYMNPLAIGGFAGYGALNAPGVRNVVTELMAPRENPLFDRAAEQLRKRARLTGMFGAPAAIDYYGGQ